MADHWQQRFWGGGQRRHILVSSMSGQLVLRMWRQDYLLFWSYILVSLTEFVFRGFLQVFNDLNLRVVVGSFFAVVTRFLQLTSKFFAFILLMSVFWAESGFLLWLNRSWTFVIVFKDSFFDLLLWQRTRNFFIVFRWLKEFFWDLLSWPNRRTWLGNWS